MNHDPKTSKEASPKSFSRISFKTIRIIILFTILIFIGLDQWLEKKRITDWEDTLWVVVYPVNGDGSSQSESYIRSLQTETFNSLERFMEKEATRYHLELQHPIRIELAPEISTRPPTLPTERSVPNIIWWSLKMRFWASRSDTYNGPTPDIRIFAIYFDPQTHKVLNHSFGLEKGRIGIANIFADARQAEQNNLVIVHEMLHTLGASDKYDLNTLQPSYPEGYAEPNITPRYPQKKAEIMGGRIPRSRLESELPNDLSDALIGEQTGIEIHWVS